MMEGRTHTIMLVALVLLAALPLSYATDDSSMSSFFNDSASFLEGQGRNFVDSGGVVADAPPTVFTSVYGAFSSGNCGDGWITTSGGRFMITNLWFAPAILAAMTVLLGVACVYMVGQLLSSPQLIALSKEELFQTGVTVLRVSFLVGMIAAGDVWYGLSAAGGNDIIYNNPNHGTVIDAAMGFSRLMVSDMVSHYGMLIMYNMVIHTLYSSTMWVGVTWRAMYSFNLGPVLKPLIDIVGTALQYLSLGISEWLLHIVTLCLIRKWTWGLFIPLSILLRAFPYTRNAGEALFALVFALAVFYPLMFIFDYEAHKIMSLNLVDSKDALSNFLHRSGILGLAGLALVQMFLMAGVFMPFFLGGALNLAFELVRSSVYYIVIMSVLLPFLNIFITLTAAKETANFFRVDVNFMSFLKII